MAGTIRRVVAPDLDQSRHSDGEIRPSRSRPELYVDPGHRSIFARTENIPGWQMPGDTYKIYEMAHLLRNWRPDIRPWPGCSNGADFA